MENVIKIFKWCRRYISITLLIVVTFIVYVLFFNENSISKSFEYNKIIDSLNAEIKINQDTLRHYRLLNSRLSSEPEAMERVAREQYLMNRINEDVYIFE